MRKLLRNRKLKEPASQKKAVEGKSPFKDTLSVMVLVASLAGTLLAFIGYGVAIEANILFNIPHETLFQSTFELIELSVWAISTITAKMGDVSFRALYVHVFYRCLATGGLIFVSWIVLYTFIKLPKAREKMASKAADWKELLLIPPNERVSFKIAVLQALLGAMAFVIAAPLVLIFATYVMLCGVIFLPAVSLIGAGAAEVHFKEYVVEPKKCLPLMNREYRVTHQGRTEEKMATCLVVTVPRHDPVRGREVLTTSSAIVVYDPDDGKVVRVPLRNATVEVVDKL